MSDTAVINRPTHTIKLPPIPPLESGDHLSRAEFERRYEAMPRVKKAELIEGVVHMPSPVHFASHGQPHAHIIGWLAVYAAATPNVKLGDNATVRLDADNELQPDALLRLDDKKGGNSRVSQDDYDEKGIIRSRLFPGLGLAVHTLLADDLATVLATCQQGLAEAGE